MTPCLTTGNTDLDTLLSQSVLGLIGRPHWHQAWRHRFRKHMGDTPATRRKARVKAVESL